MEVLWNPWVLVSLFVISMVVGGVWAWRKAKAAPAAGNGMQVQSAVLAVVLALAVLFSLPTLSIDIEGIFTYAFDIVNAFMPLIAIVAGLGLGFNLVSKIGGLFKNAL
jgi:hypothetical protein